MNAVAATAGGATLFDRAKGCHLVVDLFAEPVVNHRPAVERGLLAAESSALLESFFSARR